MNDNWKFDLEHSELFFSAKHLMISNVTGRVEDFEVKLNSKTEEFHNAEFEAIARTASFTTWNKIRDEHILNSDFLDAENYPEIHFKSTSFEPGNQTNEFKLKGNLQIRGISNPVELKVVFGGLAKDSFTHEIKAGFTVTGEIDRRDWNINFNIPLETGQLAVGYKVKITANIQFVHQ